MGWSIHHIDMPGNKVITAHRARVGIYRTCLMVHEERKRRTGCQVMMLFWLSEEAKPQVLQYHPKYGFMWYGVPPV
jgi:hypothetical protein